MGNHDCIQEERITRLEVAVGEVKDLISAQNTDVAVIKEQIGGIAELTAILRGEKDEPGLVAAVHTLNEFFKDEKETRKWFQRVIVGATVTAIVGGIVGLIFMIK